MLDHHPHATAHARTGDRHRDSQGTVSCQFTVFDRPHTARKGHLQASRQFMLHSTLQAANVSPIPRQPMHSTILQGLTTAFMRDNLIVISVVENLATIQSLQRPVVRSLEVGKDFKVCWIDADGILENDPCDCLRAGRS